MKGDLLLAESPNPSPEPPCGAPTFLSAWFEELAHADKNVGAPTARFRGSKRESLVRRNLPPGMGAEKLTVNGGAAELLSRKHEFSTSKETS